MLERILGYSISHRRLILLLALVAAAAGVHALLKLPIDAVPDITNQQVQVNTLVPSLSPEEVEKQVTFPIETTLAGIPGLQSTRSLSRNGFSQVTAIFSDAVDIEYARAQIDQRLRVARQGLPPGAEPIMGPVTTGLGEVYMWAVDYQHPGGKGSPIVDGKAGWQSDGTYLTAEGRRLGTDTQRAAYLRGVQDWVIRPQLKLIEGVAEIDSLGGYERQYSVQPSPMTLVSYGLTFSDVVSALERNNGASGAGYVEHHGESFPVRVAGLLRSAGQIEQVKVGEHEGTVVRIADVANVVDGEELRAAPRRWTAARWSSARR